MQKQLFILVAITLGILKPAYAQNWLYYHNRPSAPTPITILEDSLVLFGMKSEWIACPEFETIALDKNGIVKWKSEGGLSTKATDSALYIINYNSEAWDVVYRAPFIEKLATDGDRLYTIDINPIIEDEWHVPPVNIDVSNAGYVLATSVNGLLVMEDKKYERSISDREKELIYNRIFEEEVLGAYFGTSSYEVSFIIVFSNKIVKEIIFPDEFSERVEYPLEYEVDDHFCDNESLYLLEDSILHRWQIDPDEEGISIENYDKIIDFKVKDSVAWFLLKQEDYLIQTYDVKNRKQLQSYTLEYPQLDTIYDFQTLDSTLIISGVSHSGHAMLYYHPINTVAKTSSKDIALKAADIEVMPIPVSNLYEDNTYKDYKYTKNLDIENKGTTTIDSAWVYSRLTNGGIFCYAGEYQWIHGDLFLKPGETKRVAKEITTRVDHSLVRPNLSNLCFEIIAPDSKYDINPQNNSLCADAVVSSKTVNPLNDLQIYPNPSTNRLFIDSPLPISSLKIYDNTGRICLIKKNIHDSQPLDISLLKNGVYVVEIIMNDETILVTKLVVNK